jgi:hypothetical protein
MTVRTRAALAVTGAAILLLTGCSGPGATTEASTPDARPVTTEESQVLATMRFRNFDAGARSIDFALADDGEVRFRGWFDYGSGTGYGSLAHESGTDLLLWNAEFVAVHPHPSDSGEAPLPIPETGTLEESWDGGPLRPGDSRRDAVLAIVGSLGADRPENPLLLQQAGALWLDEQTVDGVDLTVFAGPPSDDALDPGESADPDAATTRFWVDPTGLAVRVDVRLGGEESWTELNLGDADGVRIADVFAEAAR